MTKMHPRTLVTSTRNEVRGSHIFVKEEISRFHVCNFESGTSLGRKVLFFYSLGKIKISRSFKLYPSDKLPKTIRIMVLLQIFDRFDLGNKSFETELI